MENAIEFFPNLNALLAANASRKLNRAFKDCSVCASSYESARQTNFAGTASYAEAERLCREGWFEKLDDFKEACSIRPTNQLRRRVVTSPIGYAPHVPNAIVGRPDSMIKTIMQQEKTKVLEVVVCRSVTAGTTTQEIRKFAAEIVKAISAIEATGIRVSLIWCASSTVSDKHKGQLAQCFVELKSQSEKINPSRIYFALVHPSAHRRIAFRWLETCPSVKSKKFADGYGYTVRLNKLNMPPRFAKAKFINLIDVIGGDWDAKEILARLK